MNSPVCVIAVAGALACGLSIARPTAARTDELSQLDGRVAELEKELTALKSEVASLRKAPAADGGKDAVKADLDEVVRWVQAQGVAAQALQKALDDSRAKGFTAGINPQSRDLLLAGLGESAKAASAPLKLSASEPKSPASAAPGRPAQR